MKLTLILGPMKSGKSFELINYFAPLKYTKQNFALFHPASNVRDEQINSRNGVYIESVKIQTIKNLIDGDYSIIGIDEIHMFPESEAEFIEQLLKKGTEIIISGLDMDHAGRLFPIVQKLMEMGPAEIKMKKAVCELCQDHNATYTQVLYNNEPIAKNLPPSIPDDGTFTYKPVCRKCFIK
ncbi:hypothetical protein A2331_00480 [Candidatus Falkowbacteria bacterium RIFOXYB2_FULL_34_18]|uniref:Thymidine kinase n=1 Tax=Candidatus Falkowbacteria bacterium RIFOXYD2_FULL_34_120 TaxID=1798007 RepID=A0A1F5TMT8_9BACT|nr:MAG: hypothetical protein A2331_00480 [Candidatus Falkowbacteria bacterium RIFOXYB2_FULL_34_18]OGF28523.1 MAG: hypothetical protein A2500_06705 [Candidatus Falkowbacteria bacterium RIFOXYC12_FULL_34_55]OGF38140.1 MAG: hypothetical protein A2466_00090 [Candidatus Falkowbacteria bacterium RIFOXYC2_FULL_34_220]OGF38541.1 MAG: hypothetical protein A2515_05140 [Candidatus Falkowbacteria bacterium RIFOXYD12_FULL_34_57]OGF40208.1 MAG: hypothetical protein A2531_04615 [Candidatus Falkowbacteria bact